MPDHEKEEREDRKGAETVGQGRTSAVRSPWRRGVGVGLQRDEWMVWGGGREVLDIDIVLLTLDIFL